MLCRKPFVRGAETYGCGQCMPCRFNRRRVWTHRLMLEALVHPSASFVTLTYDEANVPAGGVDPRALQLYLKRLRKSVPHRVRYFGVGEYGEVTWRPHYHLALFSLSRADTGVITAAWPYGFTHVAALNVCRAQYLCGYVVKKLTRVGDERLDGLHPEFARMSLRPGIGAVAADQVAEAMCSRVGWDSVDVTGDVPSVLRHGARTLPLGRYLRARLRLGMSFVDGGREPDEVFRSRTAEVSALYDAYCLVEKAAGRYAAGRKAWTIAESAQAIRNLEARMKIRAGRRKL